ncbi:hypothetical protein ABI59_07890 [Acidobacteria bacterium Mor1]|nr:hypothetical protein ABI59_07890 [Acidobacteria bacterium Mor1]
MFRFTIRCAVLLAAATSLCLAGAPDGDVDGDGVFDYMDNCLLDANPDQRDTDRDGFGNRCDPDFDQNGVVTEADELFLLHGIDAEPPEIDTAESLRSQRLMDLNGDGVVDLLDLEILRTYNFRAPGPIQDFDMDGVLDGLDACPGSRRGGTQVIAGCSAIDLTRDPQAVLAPSSTTLTRTMTEIGDDPGATAVKVSLDAARREIAKAERFGRRGNPCGGMDALTTAMAHVETARVHAQTRVHQAEHRLIDHGGEGDATPAELQLMPLRLTENDIRTLSTQVREVRTGFAATCEMAEPFSATGKVLSVRDGREVEIGGMRLAIADDAEFSGAMAEGVSGSVEGLRFGDGTGVITAAQFVDLADLIVANNCLRFRFVPVQRMAPQFQGPYVLHDPEGYRLGERYMFEGGMRFAAENVCTPPDPTGKPAEPSEGPITIQPLNPTFRRYSLTVILDYIDRDGIAKNDRVMAYDLEPGDTPLPMWAEIDPDEPVFVEVLTRVQDCTRGNGLLPFGTKASLDCGEPHFLRTDHYELSMREKGERCVVTYDRNELSVDDRFNSAFDQTWVDGKIVVSVWDEGTEPFFAAEGFAMCPLPSGGFQRCPYIEPIYEQHSFTFGRTDFWPVIDPGGAEWLEPFVGVTKAAGLRWPRVSGINNGLPWQFSCSLPTVVRDVVNFCSSPTPVNAYYRMPFPQGVNSWVQSQGNQSGGDNTHSDVFAYDMDAPCGDTMLAARAGVVRMVTEGNQAQMADDCLRTSDCPSHTCCNNPDGCRANVVSVQHQDGSFVQYLHSPEDGIVPEQGDVVRRGEILAFVGTTGNSTGPHLHFEAGFNFNNSWQSHLALFEAVNSDDSSVMTCYEPPSWPSSDSHHYNLRSNNIPQP